MAPSVQQMEALMHRIRASDRDAFADLFRSLHAPVLAYAESFVSDGADDLVQDVFIRLWENRASIDPQPSIRAYLFTAVRNRALNQMRDTKRRRELRQEMFTSAPPVWPDREAATAELRKRVREWIAALPERRREAFELSRFSGLSYNEIASVMDISPRTVETHIRRTLEDLRARLRDYQPDLLR